jgi:hypothetical protein
LTEGDGVLSLVPDPPILVVIALIAHPVHAEDEDEDDDEDEEDVELGAIELFGPDDVGDGNFGSGISV